MRFTNGFWLLREGVRAYYGKTAHRIDRTESGLTIESLGWAILGSIVMSIASFIARWLFRILRIL